MNEITGGTAYNSMLFPSCAAVYQPLNESFVTEDFEISPLYPYAHERYIFVTDTGNHRVVMLNASSTGQLEYIGQWGVTAENLAGDAGLDWPLGIGIYTPGWETNYTSIFANVFVADRGNNRIVKLNLGHNATGPMLTYGGQYGTQAMGAKYNETLNQPVGVAVFRHYILVAEARGNAITVLTMDYQDSSSFIFVTHLKPAYAVQLIGSLAVTPDAFLWYTHTDLPQDYGIASIYLPEALRESVRPAPIDDVIFECVNHSWYHFDMRFNETTYIDLVTYRLNASGINWLFPDRPGYVDIMVFNLTWNFDLDAWNKTVYHGEMVFCEPPPPSTTPGMLSGDKDGWKMAGVVRRSHARQMHPSICWALLIFCSCSCISLLI